MANHERQQIDEHAYTGDTVDLTGIASMLEAQANERARKADTEHTLRGKVARKAVEIASELEYRLDKFMRGGGF